jgi:hypothetical protein
MVTRWRAILTQMEGGAVTEDTFCLIAYSCLTDDITFFEFCFFFPLYTLWTFNVSSGGLCFPCFLLFYVSPSHLSWTFFYFLNIVHTYSF